MIRAEDGEKGYIKDCFGKNAEHTVVKVPVGTIMRDIKGRILADLDQDGMMFIAARGGAGGHGNAFFKSDTQQSPEICEYGAIGEDLQYVIEVRSMAHVGLVSVLCVYVIIHIYMYIYSLHNHNYCYNSLCYYFIRKNSSELYFSYLFINCL